jgi:hypothetical protein
VTWGSDSTGVSGIVSEANSLVGSSPDDGVGVGLATQSGSAITLLDGGSYLVLSPNWNSQRGAVTWGNGSAGTSGIVSEDNSLVGSNPGDLVGVIVTDTAGHSAPDITGLSNGNYLIGSPAWNGQRGAATWGDGTRGVSSTVSEANSLTGTDPGDRVGSVYVSSPGGYGYWTSDIVGLSNGNYVVGSPDWNNQRGAATWGNGILGASGAISAANSLVGSSPGDRLGDYVYFGGIATPGLTPLSDDNYAVVSPAGNGGKGAVAWVDGTTGQTLDGQGITTPQNSLIGVPLAMPINSPIDNSFLESRYADGTDFVTVGLPDPNELRYARGEAQTQTVTPEFLTTTLDTGTAVVLQASNDITVDNPISVSAAGHGGALSLEAGRSIVLNALITTDDGALNLIANDELANGVVDSQRDAGPAVISMAPGTLLNTGSGNLTVELRDGAGLSNSDSGPITLQAVTAGSVWVSNDGPSAGSNVNLGPVTSRGSQYYANPHGTTRLAANLSTADSSIRFNDAVAVNDGVTVTAGTNAVFFDGMGTQTLQSGTAAQLGNINHTGSGTLGLTSGLNMAGCLINQAGTFDANNQPVNVTGLAALLGGTYLAGIAPQRFSDGLTIAGGVFTSSNSPMGVSGGVRLVGGLLSGIGTVDTIVARGGTVAPGGNSPGVLTVSGPVTFNPATTVSILLNGIAAGTGYSQLAAGGQIDLRGSVLSLTLGFEPPVGSRFEILTNAGPAPINGTFNGLAEGAVFSQGGYQFQITYEGGTGGNSVVLTRLA